METQVGKSEKLGEYYQNGITTNYTILGMTSFFKLVLLSAFCLMFCNCSETNCNCTLGPNSSRTNIYITNIACHQSTAELGGFTDQHFSLCSDITVKNKTCKSIYEDVTRDDETQRHKGFVVHAKGVNKTFCFSRTGQGNKDLSRCLVTGYMSAGFYIFQNSNCPSVRNSVPAEIIWGSSVAGFVVIVVVINIVMVIWWKRRHRIMEKSLNSQSTNTYSMSTLINDGNLLAIPTTTSNEDDYNTVFDAEGVDEPTTPSPDDTAFASAYGGADHMTARPLPGVPCPIATYVKKTPMDIKPGEPSLLMPNDYDHLSHMSEVLSSESDAKSHGQLLTTKAVYDVATVCISDVRDSRVEGDNSVQEEAAE